MATKKVYPFIHAKQCGEGIEDNSNVVFDAREVESYSFYSREDDDDIEEDDAVTVCFKSGKEIKMYLGFGADISYENLVLAINKVQCSHFWHDNEDSTPDGYKGED